MPLLGFRSPSKSYVLPELRCIGFTAYFASEPCFHAQRAFPRPTVPSTNIVEVHPSLAFVPFRVPSLRFPHNPFQNCACLPKVSSLFAASLTASTQHGFFLTRYVPPTGFLSLSTVCSAHQIRRPISSHKPRPGLCPVQGLPAPCSQPASSTVLLPPCRCQPIC